MDCFSEQEGGLLRQLKNRGQPYQKLTRNAKKSTFSLCIKSQPISALFGRIRGCVPQAEARWHPCPTGGHSAPCRICAAKPHHAPAQRSWGGEEARRSEGYGARADENRGDDFRAGETTPHLLAVRIETDSGGETILPTLGWGKQSVWLAASGCQTPFCGQKPAPTFRRPAAAPLLRTARPAPQETK